MFTQVLCQWWPEESLRSLQLETQAVVSHVTWVLETTLLSERDVLVTTEESAVFLQAPNVCMQSQISVPDLKILVSKLKDYLGFSLCNCKLLV